MGGFHDTTHLVHWNQFKMAAPYELVMFLVFELSFLNEHYHMIMWYNDNDPDNANVVISHQ